MSMPFEMVGNAADEFPEEPVVTTSSDVETTPEFDTNPEAPDSFAPEEVGTPFATLKERREEQRRRLVLELKIPRWTKPELVLQLHPVETAKLAAVFDDCRDKYGDEWVVKSNSLVLVRACNGIYEMRGKVKTQLAASDSDSNKVDWKKLADAFGLEVKSAVDALIELFFTDGDLLETCAELIRWSGASAERVDSDFSTP